MEPYMVFHIEEVPGFPQTGVQIDQKRYERMSGSRKVLKRSDDGKNVMRKHVKMARL